MWRCDVKWDEEGGKKKGEVEGGKRRDKMM